MVHLQAAPRAPVGWSAQLGALNSPKELGSWFWNQLKLLEYADSITATKKPIAQDDASAYVVLGLHDHHGFSVQTTVFVEKGTHGEITREGARLKAIGRFDIEDRFSTQNVSLRGGPIGNTAGRAPSF
jgi:hypothetical protein